jgi:hypothetical protein
LINCRQVGAEVHKSPSLRCSFDSTFRESELRAAAPPALHYLNYTIMQVLGNGYALVSIGKMQYVRSVPGELSMDRNAVLELAQDRGAGYITREEVVSRAGWTVPRADAALAGLLRDGLAMLDDGARDGLRRYWFPCLAEQQQNKQQQ